MSDKTPDYANMDLDELMIQGLTLSQALAYWCHVRPMAYDLRSSVPSPAEFVAGSGLSGPAEMQRSRLH